MAESGAGDERSAGPEGVRSPHEFAVLLTKVRERAALTVRQVARAAGVPSATAGGYFSGRHLPPVNRPEVLTSILRACGVTDEDVLDAWLDAARRVRHVRSGRKDGPGPYQGLVRYESKDHADLFGRDAMVAQFVTVLRSARPGSPFVMLGPSGAGKSSLLRAGLLPLAATELGLRQQVLFTPGADPFGAWATAYVQATGADPQVVIEQLQTVQGRVERLAELGPVMVVVDQFEEVFTLCEPQVSREFVAALVEVSRSAATPPATQ